GLGRAGAARRGDHGSADHAGPAVPSDRARAGDGRGAEAVMNLGLEGKVALITGGSSDVGRAIATALARDGAAVAVNYLSSDAAATRVVDEITKAGGRALAHRADIADYAEVERMIERVAGALGAVDILVNNAGYLEQKFFLE